jgi:hypothetical protein
MDRREEEERAEEAARKAQHEADARECLCQAGLPVETDNQRAPVYCMLPVLRDMKVFLVTMVNDHT